MAHNVQHLTVAAYNIVSDRMQKQYGNVLSEPHTEALMRTVGLFSHLAYKKWFGRIVVDLPTGGGKTLSVISWLTAVHKLGLNISVTISASQIEALTKMIRELEAQGVPREKIGLIHQKEYCPDRAAKFRQAEMEDKADKYDILKDEKTKETRYASEDVRENNGDRQFLFVSHQRIRVAADNPTKEAILEYKGKQRDILIWDEVLVSTRATAAPMADIRSGIDSLPAHVELEQDGSTLRLAYSYLITCRDWIQEEYQRQCDGANPTGLVLKALGDEELAAYKKVIREKLGDTAKSYSALEMLLEASGQELRLARYGDIKSALIGYRVTIPTSLQAVAILDAGHVVNRLVGFDPTIRRDEFFEKLSTRGIPLKTYDRVKVFYAKGVSGKKALEDAYRKRTPGDFPSKIVETIASIPKDEAIIIFAHKLGKRKDSPDIKKAILKDLRDGGVDTDAKVADGKPRIIILTWGHHTSLNEYSHASNVLFVSVLHIPDETLVATAVGQTGNLLTPLDDRFNVTDIRRGDHAGSLYQALSRGSCRFTENGSARPMKVWLCHHDEGVKVELNKLMPGLVWEDWNIGNKRDASKVETIALQITSYLREQTANRIGNKTIKAALNLQDISPSTFKRATATTSAPGWVTKGQSFVRPDTAEAFGF